MLRAPTLLIAALCLAGCVVDDPAHGELDEESRRRDGGPRHPHLDAGAADAGTADPGTVDAGTPATIDASVDAATTPPPPTGAPDCRDPSTWPTTWVAFEDEVVTRVNQRRAAGASCGGVAKPAVGPLVVDAALRQAARCHSLDMAVNGYFSHTGQDGSTPWTRIADAGYTASPTGENLAAGYPTPQAVVDGWMASSGHCNNIMNGSSNETGVGYAYLATAPWGHYWTETFGHR